MLKTQNRTKLKSMFISAKPTITNMISINKRNNSYIIKLYPGTLPDAIATILNKFAKTYGLIPVKTSGNHFVITIEKAELIELEPVSIIGLGYASPSIKQDVLPSIHILKSFIRRHGCVIIE